MKTEKKAKKSGAGGAPETWKRSMVKAASYRLLIMALDFTAIYLFTHRSDVATGFVLLSNVYTTVAYVGHERIWAKIKWGADAGPARRKTPRRAQA
jgi:uncharacterized membrane protein